MAKVHIEAKTNSPVLPLPTNPSPPATARTRKPGQGSYRSQRDFSREGFLPSMGTTAPPGQANMTNMNLITDRGKFNKEFSAAKVPERRQQMEKQTSRISLNGRLSSKILE